MDYERTNVDIGRLLMATMELISQLRATIEKVLIYKNKPLITRPEWGEITFVDAEFDIKTVINLSESLNEMPLEYLPDQAASNIKTSFDNILPRLTEIDAFSISNGDPSSRRTNLIRQLHDYANAVFSQVATWMPFLAYQRGDVTENIKKLVSTITEAQQKMAEGVAKIEAKQKQADEILVKAREAAANAGAAVFTQDFQNEFVSNSENSKLWLGGTILLGLVAVGIAIVTYFDDYTQYTTNTLLLWPKLGSKMLLLSLCVTASMWCGRIYKSTRHIAILNRHRALALKTFQAFSAAASDSHTKDAVLMETTHSIFGNVTTGLINESCNSESDSNIIQIAGRVMEQAGEK